MDNWNSTASLSSDRSPMLRLGYVTISAIGSPNDSHHPNVLRLSIIRSSLGSFPGWDSDFDNEKRMYEKLRPLQGTLIPRCLCEGTCEGTRALVLSEVEGEQACRQKKPWLEPAELQRRLEVAFRQLEEFGVGYGDLKLNNFLIAGDGMVVVDLESVYEDTPDELDYATRTHIAHLKGRYERHLDGMCDGY
ncbi:hypothetical protein PLIIFM63780_008251 [Purpureocillium lilacinum]|nr:hypothetical protein PLIIFM63780_008251 [Purpureocillium lilacinum]